VFGASEGVAPRTLFIVNTDRCIVLASQMGPP
jgi:hypothetical protein